MSQLLPFLASAGVPETLNSIAFGKAPQRGERGQNMLHIGYLIILDGESIKKISSEILLPSASPPRRESNPSYTHPK